MLPPRRSMSAAIPPPCAFVRPARILDASRISFAPLGHYRLRFRHHPPPPSPSPAVRNNVRDIRHAGHGHYVATTSACTYVDTGKAGARAPDESCVVSFDFVIVLRLRSRSRARTSVAATGRSFPSILYARASEFQCTIAMRSDVFDFSIIN